MVRRGQPYRTAAQQKGASMRASGRSSRSGYTRSEIKEDIRMLEVMQIAAVPSVQKKLEKDIQRRKQKLKYGSDKPKGKKEQTSPYPYMFKPKKQKRKFRIEIDRVQTKPRPKYANNLYDAKHKVAGLLDKYPHGLARIKVLKKNGKSYKSKSSHWMTKSRETGRKRITNL